MAKAFGSSATDEARLNLHKLSKKLVGDVGVLFTNRSVEDIKQLVSQYHQLDYARAGVVATQSVHLPAGELVKYPVEDNEVFPPNMEPQLRKLGIPTCLKKGKVVIEQPYVICDEGQTLNPNQAQLLKLFNVALADFQIKLLCYWNNDTLVDSF
ncbi:mRNA turnover protein-like protein [Zancudomyces culisetae]|uniref:mRNA turnover protein-like protein n=1 Tax=Zancudomyces culisetae TaxID=1213189 RepID=A0A1R1PQH4_ZANCU|nr:mRNA turnover protein-like protein [Zancudomyces culisetae]|eukprot:OMH83191.1 mRNA turnover protein-like protein [Zancudomyces culisetae]